MKILIVEDDVVLSRLLREYLQQLGHEKVQVCLNGGEACTIIDNENFDAAFIDLRLPDMDGLRLLDAIKSQDPTVPVVMMSGYPTMEYTIQAMRKGASDFLTKPFTLKDLAMALERVTKERKLLLENLSLQLECRTQKQLEKVNRELEERVREQAALFAISRRIDEIRSSDELYPCIVNLASHLSSSQGVGLFILPPEQSSILLISEFGLLGKTATSRIIEVQTCRLKEIFNTDASYIRVGPDELFGDGGAGGLGSGRVPFTCWPLRIRGELFGFLLASRGSEMGFLSPTEEKLLDFLIKKAALAIENMALYESLMGNFYGILRSLVNALEAKDPYTGKHSERVTSYAVAIARTLDCSQAQLEALQTVGYLHDIGKIGVADRILNKSGPLTFEEQEVVKRHPVIGDSIVADLGFSSEERSIIRHHHESWCGHGYPDGLSGNGIPLLARIITVADAFDAMTSMRAYRDAMSGIDALQELRRNRGVQFDPDVVDAFLDVMEAVVSEEEGENGKPQVSEDKHLEC